MVAQEAKPRTSSPICESARHSLPVARCAEVRGDCGPTRGVSVDFSQADSRALISHAMRRKAALAGLLFVPVGSHESDVTISTFVSRSRHSNGRGGRRHVHFQGGKSGWTTYDLSAKPSPVTKC
jgi:hypothetical protein